MVQLEAVIEKKRQLLNANAMTKGPLHEDVLKISKELDIYIYQYMVQKLQTKKRTYLTEAI